MFELSEIEELANQVNLSILYEIAKNSAQIGNEILKVNYNKIQHNYYPLSQICHKRNQLQVDYQKD